MLQNGAIVADKYKIVEKIGSGGMSTVYLAVDVKLKKEWTIKEIIKTGGEKKDRVNLQSLIDEANLIKRFDHPSIPRIVDIIDTKDTVFIVRDYIDGEPMDQVLMNYGAQPENSIIEWTRQLCNVLDYLHHLPSKVIYRDMKPANIMLVSDGSLRLIDFGIAKDCNNDNNSDRFCMGTRGFAPPEQTNRDRKTDERSDIYALGMTMYQLATGISPAGAGFDRSVAANEINSHISSRLAKIIDKCIQENPDDRYQNSGELSYALGKLNRNNDSDDKREKFLADFRNNTSIACVIFATVFFVLGLFGNSELFSVGVARRIFDWNVNLIMNAKNIYFSLCLVFAVLFGVLKIERIKRTVATQNEDILKGRRDDFIVSDVQKGSMMDILNTSTPLSFGGHTTGFNGFSEKFSEKGSPLEVQESELCETDVQVDEFIGFDETEMLKHDENSETDMIDVELDELEDITECAEEFLISSFDKTEILDGTLMTESFEETGMLDETDLMREDKYVQKSVVETDSIAVEDLTETTMMLYQEHPSEADEVTVILNNEVKSDLMEKDVKFTMVYRELVVNTDCVIPLEDF